MHNQTTLNHSAGSSILTCLQHHFRGSEDSPRTTWQHRAEAGMCATLFLRSLPCSISPPRTNRQGQFVPSSSRPRPSSYLHKTIWHHRNQRTDVPRARGSDDRQNVAETTKGQTVIPEVKGTQDNSDYSQPKVSVSSALLTLPAHPGTEN